MLCHHTYFADPNAEDDQEPGVATVELDMIFPEDEYLEMIDEYVRRSLFKKATLYLICTQNYACNFISVLQYISLK